MTSFDNRSCFGSLDRKRSVCKISWLKIAALAAFAVPVIGCNRSNEVKPTTVSPRPGHKSDAAGGTDATSDPKPAGATPDSDDRRLEKVHPATSLETAGVETDKAAAIGQLVAKIKDSTPNLQTKDQLRSNALNSLKSGPPKSADSEYVPEGDESNVVEWINEPVEDVRVLTAVLTDATGIYPGYVISGADFIGDSKVPDASPNAGKIRPLAALQRLLAERNFAIVGLKSERQKFSAQPGSLSDFQAKVLDCALKQQRVSTKAQVKVDFASTSEQAAVRLGVKANYAGFSLKVNAEQNKRSHQSNILVLFRQEYFNIRVDDLPPLSQDFFDSKAIGDEGVIKAALDDMDYPCYVSNVSYGRVALLNLQVKGGAEEAMLAVAVAYNALAASAEATLTVESKKAFEGMTGEILLWGGPPKIADNLNAALAKAQPADGAQARAADPVERKTQVFSGAVEELLRAAVPYFLPDSDPSNAQPIGFTVARLKDNAEVDVVSAAPGSYSRSQKVQFEYKFCPQAISINEDGGAFGSPGGEWQFVAAQLPKGRGGADDKAAIDGSHAQVSMQHSRKLFEDKSDFPTVYEAPIRALPVAGDNADIVGLIKQRKSKWAYNTGEYLPSRFTTLTGRPNLWVICGDSDKGDDNAPILATHFLGAPKDADEALYFQRFDKNVSLLQRCDVDLIRILKNGRQVDWENNSGPAREMLFSLYGPENNMCVFSIRVKEPSKPKTSPPEIPEADTGDAKEEGKPEPAKLQTRT